MTTPGEVKFMLEAGLLAMARDGVVPRITGVHSIVVEGSTVFVCYDVEGAETSTLDFEFELPPTVTRDELRQFSEWLAASGYTDTLH